MGNTPNQPLIVACRTGNLKNVQDLLNTLQSNEICLLSKNGTTALHEAVVGQHIDIIKALIGRCCSRTTKDKSGKIAYKIAPTPSIQLLLRRPSKFSRFEQKPHFFLEKAFGLWR